METDESVQLQLSMSTINFLHMLNQRSTEYMAEGLEGGDRLRNV